MISTAAPPSPVALPPSSGERTVVTTNALRKAYRTVVAVEGVTMEVPRGTVVGLLGPNGAGKTTLIRMLLGLARPTSGQASLLGSAIGSPGYHRARTRVGAMIEGPSPYGGLSGRRNIEVQAHLLGIPSVGPAVDRALDLVELTDRQHDRAKGYSLGMKQRLGIATALVANPELLILDEPANGLDPAGIVELRHMLRRLADAGTTVLVSSHQLAEVQQACDSLVIMAKGVVVTSGTTGEVLAAHSGRPELRIEVDAADRVAAVAALAPFGATRPDGGAIVLAPDTDRGPVDGSTVNRALFAAGVSAQSLTTTTRTLEDVFLDLTTEAHR